MIAGLALHLALGTRDGRLRTALTALAAGFAVALLLLGAAVPGALAARDVRGAERSPMVLEGPRDAALLWGDVQLTTGGAPVTGALVRPLTEHPPLPPGVRGLPRAGAMLVSPALRRALAAGDDPVLAARLPYRVAGDLGDADLLGPGDLRFLAVEPRLRSDGPVAAVAGFGGASSRRPLDAALALLLVVGVVVLLVPIAVVLVLAGRFGAERRDRRLAALRLAGMSARTTSRLLALEAAIAGTAGVVVGVVLFLLLRQTLQVVRIGPLSVFPADAVPAVPLAVVVLLAVPAAVVVTALAGFRAVAVEPLGVVRRTTRRPRLLLWRLAPIALGAILLAVAARGTSLTDGTTPVVAASVVALLLGALAVLPWLVERIARAAPGGGVAWRFARGRLVHEAGTTVRVAGAVAAALAGAIALQMLFAGLASAYTSSGGTAAPVVTLVDVPAQRAARTAAALESSAPAATMRFDAAVRSHPDRFVSVVVARCSTLVRLAPLGRCADGDAFVSAGTTDVRPGIALVLGGAIRRMPAVITPVQRARDASGTPLDGVLLATPAAARVPGRQRVTLDLPTSTERLPVVLRAALEIDPLAGVAQPDPARVSRQFDGVRRGLGVGLLLVLLLVGGVLLVSVADQLRERRAALAALAALGMRRRAMAASILLESALPVLVGAAVAALAGLVLGLVLLRVMEREPVVDPVIALDVLLALALPLLVGAAGLPLAARLMRPDGLRAE